MRPEQSHRLGELVARMTPTEFRVGKIALIAIGRAEMFADLGQAVEFVLGHVLRQPVATIVSEVEFLGDRVPIEADRVADASGDDFRTAAVEIDAADLTVL